MNIQLKSDLHWEHDVHQTRPRVSAEEDSAYVSPEAEVLVLAGDMINIIPSHIDYLKYKFEDVNIPILYVPGNHEYWGQSYMDAREVLKKSLSGSNITLLDKDSVIIKDKDGTDVLFVGATLWTSLVNPMKSFAAARTADFRYIKGITTNSWSYNHISEMSYIERTLSYEGYRDMKKVVISHYLPSERSVPPKYKGDPLNCIFVAEDAEKVIKELQPNLWLHGHTHDTNDYMEGRTRILSNPKGRWYNDAKGVNPLYNNKLIITI